MRRFLVLFILVYFYVVPAVSADSIVNFKANYWLNSDGTIKVKEQIDYHFDTSRHGIYREIPYLRTNQDGKQYKIELIDFKVNQPFVSSIENNQIKLKIGDANKTITGNQTYIIEYLIRGGLTYFSDHDELYWNITGHSWEVPILAAEAKIHLPMAIDQNLIKLKCFTGVVGSTEALCHQNYQQNRASFESQFPLSPGNGLTIVVGFPKDMVAVLEPTLYTPFWQTVFGRWLKALLSIGFALLITVWYFLYPIWIIVKWFLFGRDPKGIVGQARAWFGPPKLESQELIPGEVGVLVDEKVDLKELFATLIDLARRGYFKIEERQKNDFYFIKQPKPIEKATLHDYEQQLLTDLFSKSQEVRIKTKKMYTTFSLVSKQLYQGAVDNQLFPKNPNSIRIFYGVIAGLALMSGNLLLLIVALLFGMQMPKKTQLGVDLANQAKALRSFLVSQDRQLAFQANKQLLFEKLLPYAVVFGVEKIWAKRFANFDLKSPDWYQGQSNQFNSALLVNQLQRSFVGVSSALTSPTTSSRGFSSGFSGGSSGGGGGGGGGGSW